MSLDGLEFSKFCFESDTVNSKSVIWYVIYLSTQSGKIPTSSSTILMERGLPPPHNIYKLGTANHCPTIFNHGFGPPFPWSHTYKVNLVKENVLE